MLLACENNLQTDEGSWFVYAIELFIIKNTKIKSFKAIHGHIRVYEPSVQDIQYVYGFLLRTSADVLEADRYCSKTG